MSAAIFLLVEGMLEWVTPMIPPKTNPKCYQENYFKLLTDADCHTDRDPHMFDNTFFVYMILYTMFNCSDPTNDCCHCKNAKWYVAPVFIIEAAVKLFDMKHYTSDVIIFGILVMPMISSDFVEQWVFMSNPALTCIGKKDPSYVSRYDDLLAKFEALKAEHEAAHGNQPEVILLEVANGGEFSEAREEKDYKEVDFGLDSVEGEGEEGGTERRRGYDMFLPTL
jgi:hypothetical protein